MFPLDHFSASWFSLPMLLSGIGMLLLGAVVAIREQGSRVGLSYLALALTISIWLLSYSVMYSLRAPEPAVWWIRVMANAGVALLPIAALNLATQFVPRFTWLIGVKYATLAVSVGFWIASALTDWFIEDVRLFWWGYYADYGWLGFTFILYLGLMLGAALVTLMVARRITASPRARLRTGGLMVAYLAGYPALVDFAPVFGIPLYPFGYLFIVAFIMLTARIVWKYRLVDVTPRFASNQIIETMSEGVLVVDADGVIRVVNRTAERLLVADGVHLQRRMAATEFPDLPFLHGTELLTSQGGTSAVEFRWRKPRSEREQVLRAKSTLMYGAGQAPTAVVCVLEDITEEIEAAQNLREANRGLAATLVELGEARTEVVRRERFKALGEMVTGIAHDFNNALTPILAYAELLREREPDAPWGALESRAVASINTAAGDAAAVVARLRDWYRPGEEEISQDVIDLSRTVETVVTLTKPVWGARAQARQADINVELSLAKEAFVSGIEAELREVLTNLVLNALDAMPRGGTISIATSVADGSVHLSLADSGTGMDEATLDRCFDPFFSTKGNGGTGLGLPMVKSIVERHGGTIGVESTPGVGTTFRIAFALASAGVKVPAEMLGAHVPIEPMKVMVVDDIEASATAVVAMLESDGHAVCVLNDPEVAVETLREQPFDYLVTDLAMPKIDGLELCRIAKATQASIKTVVVTGFGDLAETGYFEKSDVDVVAKKPVSPAALRSALRAALGKDESRAA